MPKSKLTDMDVEMEIKRLQNNEFVKLGRAEERDKYRRRQYLYQLRQYEKRGKELSDSGITMDFFLRRDTYAEDEC